jgi:hypothetical protein
VLSEGEWATESVMLCDGYHRIAATRNTGIYFVWVWLAVGDLQQRCAPLPHVGPPVVVAGLLQFASLLPVQRQASAFPGHGVLLSGSVP